MTDKIDIEFWSNLSKKLGIIIDRSRNEYQNMVDALKFINNELINVIFPSIAKYKNEAIEYYDKRNKFNVKIEDVADKCISELKNNIKVPFNISIVITSSYSAKINVMNSSDIDVSILVESLDEHKLFTIIGMLNKIGYKFSHIRNPNAKHNKYYSFIKFIDDVEIEVKVRDSELSKPVIELHNYLDTQLTEDQRISITFIKYMLYQLQKMNKDRGYEYFKKLMYEAFFYYIKDGFLFDL